MMGAPTVTLRLFAAAREAVGGGRFTVRAGTVGDAVAAAVALPGGDRLESLLATCKVWRNGDEAALSDGLAEGDEVAILPPVSGG